MAKSYRVIKIPGYGETEVKKSRFLAEAVYVASEEEAERELARVRKKYYDARHSCSARILGENGTDVRSSDDGEPSGTAGRPILEVIKGAGITNCMVIVTRYFGGTLLGTGGLVRAYTEAAKAAIGNAVIAEMCLCDVLTLTFDYSLLDRILFRLREEGLQTENENYSDRVSLDVKVKQDESGRIWGELISLTAGKIEIAIRESGFYPL